MNTKIDTTLSTKLKGRTIIYLHHTVDYTHYLNRWSKEKQTKWWQLDNSIKRRHNNRPRV